MSGGSHNYLHERIEDEIGSLADDLFAMGKALKEQGLPVMSERTVALSDALHAVRVACKPMLDLWRAQEWVDSGDRGRSSVRSEAVALGEPLPPCTHAVKLNAYGMRSAQPSGTPLVSFLLCDECGEEWDAR